MGQKEHKQGSSWDRKNTNKGRGVLTCTMQQQVVCGVMQLQI